MRTADKRALRAPLLALLTAACVLLDPASAKPPPPAGAPWAAYVKSPAPYMRRAADDPADAVPASVDAPVAFAPLGYPGYPAFAPPGLAFNPIFSPAGVSPANPMAPFLKLKPTLPLKPTFMPPLVDPGKFIDMKAALLDSLFSPAALATRSMGAPPPFAGPKFAGGPPPFAKMGGPPPFVASKFGGGAPFGKKAAFFAYPAEADDGDSTKSVRALMSPADDVDEDVDAAADPVLGLVKPTKPAPYFMADLFKALNINKTVANATAPVYPAAGVGFFPGSPFAPAVDPGVMMSKKAKFLSDLFSTLGVPTTTPAPPAPSTEASPAGSIMPPDFWAPSATATAIVDPAEYTAKVSTFLDKLFDSLNISRPTAGASKRGLTEDVSDEEQESKIRVRRALGATPADDPAALLADAKDKVVDTIIGEMAALKNGMVGAVSDLAQAQKDAAAATASATAAAAAPAKAAAAKKPLKPALSPYAAFWAKPAITPPPPTPVPVEPVQQRVALLGQVFDLLTAMEKDITSAMVLPPATATQPAAQPSAPIDFMDAVNAKLTQIMNTSALAVGDSAAEKPAPKVARLVSAAAPPVDPTFWIPDSLGATGPDVYLSKTGEFLSKIMAAKVTASPATEAPTVARRSYKASYYQQQRQQEQQQQQQQEQQPSDQQRLPQNQEKPVQTAPPALPPFLVPMVAPANYYERQQHHHHHNRQPYWWN